MHICASHHIFHDLLPNLADTNELLQYLIVDVYDITMDICYHIPVNSILLTRGNRLVCFSHNPAQVCVLCTDMSHCVCGKLVSPT